MNRKDWYAHWRKIRSDREKSTPSIGDMVEVLHELYDYQYTPEQDAFITLVNRYKDKLGQKYFDKIKSWEPEAKERAKLTIKNLVYRQNPFFSMIPKKDDFFGVKYILD